MVCPKVSMLVSSLLRLAASILYLEGAEISVLQLNTNERLCVEFKFLSKLKHHHKRVRAQTTSGSRSSNDHEERSLSLGTSRVCLPLAAFPASSRSL